MKHKKKKKFQQYINEQERCESMSMESYLITPIQRLPRYELLLMQCLKYTSKTYPDYPLISQALDMLKVVNQRNNESMSSFVESQRKQILHKMFGTHIDLMRPSRNFIEEIKGLSLVEANSTQMKEMVLFLFSDCIVIAHEIEHMERYEFYNVTELDENSKCYAKQDLKYYQNIVKVTGKDKCFILFTKNAEARDLTVAKISNEIEKIK